VRQVGYLQKLQYDSTILAGCGNKGYSSLLHFPPEDRNITGLF